eukprot:816387_1
MALNQTLNALNESLVDHDGNHLPIYRDVIEPGYGQKPLGDEEPSNENGGDKEGVSSGMIALFVIVGIVILGLIALVIYCLWKKCRSQPNSQYQ